MKKLMVGAAMITCLVLASPILAIAPAFNMTPAVATQQAQVVVIGKVSELEKEKITATIAPFKGAAKIEYSVVTIKVETALHGGKGLTSLRLGYQSGGDVIVPVNPSPLIPPKRPVPGAGIPKVGDEGLYCLVKHHSADFYVLVPMSQPLPKKTADFDKQVEHVKAVAAAITDPVKALKSEKKEDREQTTIMLINRYGTTKLDANGKELKRVAIPDEESELILKTLAEMPYKHPPEFYQKLQPGQPIPPTVENFIFSLRLQEAPNYKPPVEPKAKIVPGKVPTMAEQAAFAKAYEKWMKDFESYNMNYIKENAGKFKLKKSAE